MKVRDLIEMLESIEDPDAEVQISFGKDYCTGDLHLNRVQTDSDDVAIYEIV